MRGDSSGGDHCSDSDAEARLVTQYADRVASMAVQSALFGSIVPVAQSAPWRIGAVLRALGRAHPRSDYVAIWWHDGPRWTYRYVLRSGDTARLARLVGPWGGTVLRDGVTGLLGSPGLLHAAVSVVAPRSGASTLIGTGGR